MDIAGTGKIQSESVCDRSATTGATARRSARATTFGINHMRKINPPGQAPSPASQASMQSEIRTIILIGLTLGLTSRESALMALVCGGQLDKQIAAVLKISPHTVRSHLTSIFQKMGVRGRLLSALEWERAKIRYSRNLLAGRCDTARLDARLK